MNDLENAFSDAGASVGSSATVDSAAQAVAVCNLSRSFYGKVALDDVSLQIPVGSVFGLIGLNGAGKTTLIRHLIGSLRALHGTVRVLGNDPTHHPEQTLRRIGYLTEEDSLPKWMRVGDLIDFTRAVYPTWDDGYAAQLCELFSFTRATRLQSMSKGQRARAGLLIAIAHRPELLILDEPSSGLDPIARKDILEAIIRTVNDDGRTVLFSSHLLDEVNRVCDVIALMRDGRLVETISTAAIEAQYVEIICRSKSAGLGAPDIRDAFGWSANGDEWSAIVPVEAIANADDWSHIGHIDRRPISLERWFAARALVDESSPASEPAINPGAESDE